MTFKVKAQTKIKTHVQMHQIFQTDKFFQRLSADNLIAYTLSQMDS